MAAPLTRAALLAALTLSACSNSVLTNPVSAASSTTATMRAIRIHAFGGPEVLVEDRVPIPAPGPGELRVRVIAAGINPIDAKARGATQSTRKLPFVLGWDVAGVVDAVGPGVTRFAPGDAVFAMLALGRAGAYAEQALVREDEAAPKPSKLSFVEAAAIPLSALTAQQGLFEVAKLEAGQTVLIHGGSGGVGSYAVQLAHRRGAKVLATASTANQAVLRALGADVAIDYTTTRFEDVAKGVDVVFDCVGGETLARSTAVVKKGGFVVTLVGDVDHAALEKVGARGSHMVVASRADRLAELGRLIDAGELRPPSIQELPLADVKTAHERIASGHTRGKIVLRVAPDPVPPSTP